MNYPDAELLDYGMEWCIYSQIGRRVCSNERKGGLNQTMNENINNKLNAKSIKKKRSLFTASMMVPVP